MALTSLLLMFLLKEILFHCKTEWAAIINKISSMPMDF